MTFTIFCTKCENLSTLPITSNSKYLKCTHCGYKINQHELIKIILKINNYINRHIATSGLIYYYLKAELEQDFLLSHLPYKNISPTNQFDFFINLYKRALPKDKELINPRLDIVAFYIEKSKHLPYRILYHQPTYKLERYSYGVSFEETFTFEEVLSKRLELHDLIPLLTHYNHLYYLSYNDSQIWFYPNLP